LQRLELAINSDLGDVALVAIAANRVCLHLGLDEAMAGQVELCIVEAVTNAIRHAYHDQPGNRVTVTIAEESAQLVIEVCDSGSAMPLKHQQRLVHGTDASGFELQDRNSIPEGGRGLQIIRTLMDEVSYTSKQHLNHLTMRKHLPGSSEARVT
jgi:serine/threonine-protein kinase RsbW